MFCARALKDSSDDARQLSSILMVVLRWQPDPAVGMRLGRKILSACVKLFGTTVVLRELQRSNTELDWTGLKHLVKLSISCHLQRVCCS